MQVTSSIEEKSVALSDELDQIEERLIVDVAADVPKRLAECRRLAAGERQVWVHRDDVFAGWCLGPGLLALEAFRHVASLGASRPCLFCRAADLARDGLREERVQDEKNAIKARFDDKASSLRQTLVYGVCCLIGCQNRK